MARFQTDEPLESLEELVAKANAQAKAEREAANTPSTFPCRHCLSDRLTEAQLARMDAMSHEELKTLVRASCALQGFIKLALLTEEEAYKAIMLESLHRALNEEETRDFVAGSTQWLERKRGKVAQTVDMTLEDKRLERLPTDRLMRLEAELARLSGCDALIIAPEPQKLGDDN